MMDVCNGALRTAVSFSLMTILFSGCHTVSCDDESIRVGTYNIRFSTGDKGTSNEWLVRRESLVALVRSMSLDVFGMQEVCPDQAEYLRKALPEFEFVGDHRGVDRKTDEASPVFYRIERFEAVDSGTFWLSETPEVPASKSWGSRCPRVCSYLVLRDRKNGKRFCFANTHTDHISEEAREKGMMLIIERMRTFGGGVPIVFTGDHNNTEIERPARSVSLVLRNALYVSETVPLGPWRTWNDWRWKEKEVQASQALELPENVRNVPCSEMLDSWMKVRSNCANDSQKFFCECAGPRIDYIWVSDGIRVLNYVTHGDTRQGMRAYPSDHFPVTATIRLMNQMGRLER